MGRYMFSFKEANISHTHYLDYRVICFILGISIGLMFGDPIIILAAFIFYVLGWLAEFLGIGLVMVGLGISSLLGLSVFTTDFEYADQWLGRLLVVGISVALGLEAIRKTKKYFLLGKNVDIRRA